MENFNTTAIRTKVANYIGFGFTMKEAFKMIKEAAFEAKFAPRKTNRVAEAMGRVNEKNGDYGFSGKEYGNRKWGQQ